MMTPTGLVRATCSLLQQLHLDQTLSVSDVDTVPPHLELSKQIQLMAAPPNAHAVSRIVRVLLQLKRGNNVLITQNSPPSAAVRVLGIGELLEMILLKVFDHGTLSQAEEQSHDRCAMKTVLLGQRVNKSFHAAVTNSKDLQQALWFSEGPVAENCVYRLNPLLVNLPQEGPSLSVFDYEDGSIGVKCNGIDLADNDPSWRKMWFYRPGSVEEVNCVVFIWNCRGVRLTRQPSQLHMSDVPSETTTGDLAENIERMMHGKSPNNVTSSYSVRYSKMLLPQGLHDLKASTKSKRERGRKSERARESNHR